MFFAFIFFGWKIILDQAERNFIIDNIKNKLFNKKIDSKLFK